MLVQYITREQKKLQLPENGFVATQVYAILQSNKYLLEMIIQKLIKTVISGERGTVG